MTIWIVFMLYALLSATGLFMIKSGAESVNFSIHDGLMGIQLSPRFIVGLLVYATSFMLSIYVMSRMKLSVFYPVATGTILILTCVLGYLFLKEQIGWPQIVGMVLIVAGVLFINVG